MSESAPSAAAWATATIAAVRDDTAARLALLRRTYNGPYGHAPRHLPYRRAALSFMRWQISRGVLAPISSASPGSPWWRAVNERLLCDGCESVALARGLRGRATTTSIHLWQSFIARPTAAHWYRAHNASIVAGYIENRELADSELATERFFMNVVLLRVLYAHCLVANPALALGRFAVLGRLLGDPRLGMAGAFLSLGRVLPNEYPIREDLDDLIEDEHGIGRLLDRAIISPRLQDLYEWSADDLGMPRLRDFVHDGSPAYAWPSADRHVWLLPPDTSMQRALARLTTPRRERKRE